MRAMRPELLPNGSPLKANRIVFLVIVTAFQALMLLLYGLFMRFPQQQTGTYDKYGVIMSFFMLMLLLVGFGLLMTYIRTLSWSGLGFTLFITAVSIELWFPISSAFIKQSGVTQPTSWMGLTNLRSSYDVSLTNAVCCALAVYVSYTALHGRIGPTEVFCHTVITVIGYQINRQFLRWFSCNDVGGTMGIFAFGSASGIIVSWILSLYNMRKTRNHEKYRSEVINYTYALLGTVFIWCLWPALMSAKNIQQNGQNPFVSISVINMFFALSASTWSTYSMSILLHNRISPHDVIFGAFSGAIAFGSSCNMVMNIAAPIFVGISAGIISTTIHSYLHRFINARGVIDSGGLITTYLIMSFFGGIWSSIFAVFAQEQQYYTKGFIVPIKTNFNLQGGLQLAGLLASLATGAITGLISSGILRATNIMDTQDYFDDGVSWTIEDDGLIKKKRQELQQ